MKRDQGSGVRDQKEQAVRLADFVVTKNIILTDDDLERMARRDEFDLVVLEKRGLKLEKNYRVLPEGEGDQQ